MKCVQMVGQGIPIRVTDAHAAEIVERDHDGQYCPKRVFKEYIEKYKDTEYVAGIRKQWDREQALVASHTPPKGGKDKRRAYQLG